MAVVDPARAALVTKEYRYKIVEDAAIKALYPGAREIVIETSLDEAGGTALANTVFGQTSIQQKTFSFEIEDVIFPEDFIGSSQRYTLSFDRHPTGTNTYALIGAQVDYFAGRSTITVRGV